MGEILTSHLHGSKTCGDHLLNVIHNAECNSRYFYELPLSNLQVILEWLKWFQK